MIGPKSRALQKRAAAIMPLGVNSNFRYWGDGITPYVERAKGGHIWDVDGREYIDYRLGFGPVVLGHAFPQVDQFVIDELRKGVLYAMTSELEISVVEMIAEMAPSMEMIRLACSGTEATMHAIRVARAYTGREKILKFEGNYHGFQDHTLWSTYSPSEVYGNRRDPIAIPSSSGIPKMLRELVITLPFNDFEGFERALRTHGHELAAVITEPCQGNCGAIMPKPGFLELVRKLTAEQGVVFILDEVKTGFRIANGGAQEALGIAPDMATYAKALGNGYPVAAFGGRRDIMSVVGDGVGHGGTYTNNKPGIAAAYATLKLLREKPILQGIQERGSRLIQGLQEIFEEHDIPVVMSGFPAMFSFALGITDVSCQRDWDASDRALYLKLSEAAIERGVMPDPDPREPWFLCYEHTEADVDETLQVYAEIVKAAKNNLVRA